MQVGLSTCTDAAGTFMKIVIAYDASKSIGKLRHSVFVLSSAIAIPSRLWWKRRQVGKPIGLHIWVKVEFKNGMLRVKAPIAAEHRAKKARSGAR
jgi:hypothetical protein